MTNEAEKYFGKDLQSEVEYDCECDSWSYLLVQLKANENIYEALRAHPWYTVQRGTTKQGRSGNCTHLEENLNVACY
jgi:hypothetical protein